MSETRRDDDMAERSGSSTALFWLRWSDPEMREGRLSHHRRVVVAQVVEQRAQLRLKGIRHQLCTSSNMATHNSGPATIRIASRGRLTPPHLDCSSPCWLGWLACLFAYRVSSRKESSRRHARGEPVSVCQPLEQRHEFRRHVRLGQLRHQLHQTLHRLQPTAHTRTHTAQQQTDAGGRRKGRW